MFRLLSRFSRSLVAVLHTTAAGSGLVLVGGALALCACSQTSAGVETPAPSDDVAAPDLAAAEPEASEGPPIYIAPLLVSTPVVNAMGALSRRAKAVSEDGEKVLRIGYLRVGERVLAHPEPRGTDGCAEGWFELVAGGFVCGKWITRDLKSSRARLAPHPPYTDGPLPYEYGVNMGQGTPLYRKVPKHDARLKLEPWRAPKEKPPEETANEALTGETTPSPAESVPEPVPSSVSHTKDSSKTQDPPTPWYLREADGGKIQVRLDELKERGPVARRMVRGFYVSLDKKFASGDTTWWRTASGLIAPVDRIAVQKPRTDFHGVWIRSESAQSDVDGGSGADDLDASSQASGDDSKDPNPRHDELDAGSKTLHPDKNAPWVPAGPITQMPVGIVVSSYGRMYKVDPDKQIAWATNAAPRFTIAGLTGRSADVHGRKFHQTVEGWWMGDQEGVVPEPGPAPDGLGPDEKWIDVNITHQWLIALEGTRPVYVTLISSGKRDDTNKERDHRTITGSFRIREKHISATMDDDSATDGPYSIEDVPWIMYFRNSYALHGAFWHADFGYRKSHGCVNLSPYDAKALFGWTEPKLPAGWHAIFATEQTGTRVVIHE